MASHKLVVPKILVKLKIYILTRDNLLITLCREIPCTTTEGFDEIKLGLPVVNDFSHVILGRSTSSSFPNVALS